MGRDTEAPEAASCVLVRSESAVIVAVEGAVAEVLGWQTEDLIGLPSTSFIHPEDQPSAIAAWFDMIAVPGASRTWRGRYRDGDGSWRWVESQNVNRLDDPENPRVESTIVRVTVDVVTVEEELRARKQILARLSDALPVGLFQIDQDRHIAFTNDQLHVIIASPPAATVAAQFASLSVKDWDRFDTALDAVLGDHPVDDLEVRFEIAVDGDTRVRVCRLSLRPLTDDTDTVSGAIGCVSDVTEQVRMRRELQLRANTDSLTGCLNRSAILELLELRLHDLEAVGTAGVAVIYVDLDDFKGVNDRYGHAVGDATIVHAVKYLREAIRDGDHVGRLGGDEFLVVCPNVTGDGAGDELAERVRRALDATVAVGDVAVVLHATVGRAWSSTPISADALIAEADDAMYSAKRHGRPPKTA